MIFAGDKLDLTSGMSFVIVLIGDTIEVIFSMQLFKMSIGIQLVFEELNMMISSGVHKYLPIPADYCESIMVQHGQAGNLS